jgi:hypothetical protein
VRLDPQPSQQPSRTIALKTAVGIILVRQLLGATWITATECPHHDRIDDDRLRVEIISQLE